MDIPRQFPLGPWVLVALDLLEDPAALEVVSAVVSMAGGAEVVSEAASRTEEATVVVVEEV